MVILMLSQFYCIEDLSLLEDIEKENVFTHPTVIHKLWSKLTSSQKCEKVSDIYELALQGYFTQIFKKGTFNVAATQKGVSNKAFEAKTNDNSCKVSKIQQ